MIIPNVKKYIELYNIENILFKIIGPKIKEQGYLAFDDFYKIVMWKTARQKNRYLKNQNSVEKITREALLEKDEIKKMEILCKLDGVSISVASALLTIYDPTKYGIIDIRCLEFINAHYKKIAKYPSFKTWIDYLEIIREMAGKNNITPREVDMALFAMHQEELENDNYRSLYKKYINK